MGDVDADIATVERLYTVTAATKLSPTSVLFETSMPNQAARPVASVAVLSSAATHHHLIHACTPMHIGPRQLRREHRRSATDPEERVGFRCRPYPIPFPHRRRCSSPMEWPSWWWSRTERSCGRRSFAPRTSTARPSALIPTRRTPTCTLSGPAHTPRSHAPVSRDLTHMFDLPRATFSDLP